MFKQLTAPDSKVLATSQTDSRTRELTLARAQQEYATRKAGQLLSLYPKGDARDPETYVAGLSAVLSEYPPEIIDHVCDPRTGLPRRLKWLPAIADVAEACDKQVEHAKTIAWLRAHAVRRREIIADPKENEHAKWEAREWLDRNKGRGWMRGV